MRVKGIIFDDFVNYKLPCTTIETPFCDFKCDKECGVPVCHNSSLAKATIFDIPDTSIIKAYLKNDITRAICFQGLEPLDNRFFQELLDFITAFRKISADDIVIYTGFKEEEIGSKIEILSTFPNIVVKFGRYIPTGETRFDEVLGVELASENQYARRIS